MDYVASIGPMIIISICKEFFTTALLGWILNAFADPIIYAFWYPVFRKNVLRLLMRLKQRAIREEEREAPCNNNNNNNIQQQQQQN